MKRVACACLLAVSVATSQNQAVARARVAWDVPLGVPVPPFGVTEQAGAPTHRVRPGSGCADTGNGTAATPRCTIPESLPAGAVVELSGTFTRGVDLRARGTAVSPIYLRGASARARPVMKAPWTVTGSYVVLENIDFANSGATDGTLTVLAPSDHVSIRHNEIHNPQQARGAALSIVNWKNDPPSSAAPTVWPRNIVILGNKIHDNGNWKATSDQDCHGIGIEAADHVWVLDNELWHNSGDGVQINGSRIDRAHHVFVARNVAYENKQTGFWSKTAADVVFSQNVAHGHRPSDSSGGQGFGQQYDPQRIWFLFNESYDNTIGIGGGNTDGARRDHFIIGNLLRGNLEAGLRLNGGAAGDFLVALNTLVGNPIGVENGYAGGRPTLAGNIVARSTTHVRYPQGALLRRNLFDVGPRLVGVSCASCVTGDPMFAGVADFRLLAGSPAIDGGAAPELEAAYARFLKDYGISIALDRDGLARPLGASLDMGAYEYPGK